MRKIVRAAVVWLAAVLPAAAPALAGTYEAPIDVRKEARAEFTAKPTAEQAGGGIRIKFALSAPTDVEVAVLDAEGRVVRHLAAGLLGRNAPEPFQKDSLRQELVWDGKTDDGGAAAGDLSAFKVRVRAGLSAGYGGAAFGSEARPDDLTNVIGLAAAADGRVYVLSERWKRAWWTHTAVHVFRRTGEYEKTIKPFPPTVSADKVAGLTKLRDTDGRPIPTIHRVVAISYYPTEDIPQQMAATADGNLHLFTLRAAYFRDRESSDRYISSIAPDGGQAYEEYRGAEIPAQRAAGDVYMAAASDGTALFATGVERGEGDSAARPNNACVYRIPLPGRDKAEVFFGEASKAARDETHLSDPRGVATDGKGRLFVADRGNDRVVVIDEKTGKFRSALDVKAPTWVGVNRKTGALYVASAGEVLKFRDSEKSPGPLARLALPKLADKEAAGAHWSFALDDSAEAAVVWVGLSRGGEPLLRCEEKEAGFGPLVKAGYRPARTYWNIASGYDGHTVACKVGNAALRLLDEETGATRDLALEGSGGQTYRLGPNNQVYGMDHWRWGIRRWDKDGKYMPFADTAAHAELKGRLASVPSGTTSWERDFDVDRAGNVYVKHRGKFYHGRMRVDKYDKDGRFVGTVIWVVSDGAHGPRVDGAGNVYVADAVKPVGKPYPDFFKDKLVTAKIDRRTVAHQYRWMYGSVIKFGAAGGAIWFPILAEDYGYAFDGEAKLPPDQPKVKIDTATGDRVDLKQGELQGALWFAYGASYILDMHPGHNRRCHCTATEFDVDDYGRVFFTDQGRFRVVVLDTNGNELLTFGGYGNQDFCGPESYVADAKTGVLRPRSKDEAAGPLARPEIAFNWFTGLGATDRYVYVADGGNHRVVRVMLKYAAEETCAVKR